MNARDLARYKRMLLEKHQELVCLASEAKAPIPAAGIAQGDLIDQANADSDAELEIRLRRTDGRLQNAIEEALARVRSGTFSGDNLAISIENPRKYLCWAGCSREMIRRAVGCLIPVRRSA